MKDITPKPEKETSTKGNKTPGQTGKHTETRHVVIYGYTRQELAKVMRHFEQQLPEFVKISIDNSHLVTKITLTGIDSGVELLRFRMNRYQQNIQDLFEHETLAMEDKSVAQVLGELLKERELSVACAESCTGGNIAHRITQIPGSSAYFLGSIVSYSNEVKAEVLNVSRNDINQYGAVSQQVVESMARGVSKLMRSDCAITTSGIAGPDGGTRFKPVGTVWIGVKYNDQVVSECIHFKGDRNHVIEGATNHGMVMLINLLRDKYESQEEWNEE
ncbi:MAG: CinA family protein [Clostridium sp.]|nr:CinA family protein [Prevotella sp.]MCM1428721.1 CinA family protein [Clostridium sp.]MCM1475096.1 CinA family protein [Muribaculaceae bacterium]